MSEVKIKVTRLRKAPVGNEMNCITDGDTVFELDGDVTHLMHAGNQQREEVGLAVRVTRSRSPKCRICTERRHARVGRVRTTRRTSAV